VGELRLDDRLIEKTQAAGGHKTKNEAVTAALKEYVARREQLDVLKLIGKIEFDPAHCHKDARRR
jgi:Arc/MetJ family transcription regulator